MKKSDSYFATIFSTAIRSFTLLLLCSGLALAQGPGGPGGGGPPGGGPGGPGGGGGPGADNADLALYVQSMPIPQTEGPYFTAGSPNKPDARADVATAEGWPDIHMTGLVTDLEGVPIPGLKIDFWQTDDQGSYDNSGGYNLRGHVFTDANGVYDYWSVMPANYETIRTRHLHVKIGGENNGFESPEYTTQFYWPSPYDADIDGDGVLDKIIEDGVLTDDDAISNAQDGVISGALSSVNADFEDLAANIFTIENDPVADGYFEATLNFSMSSDFQAPVPEPSGHAMLASVLGLLVFARVRRTSM